MDRSKMKSSSSLSFYVHCKWKNNYQMKYRENCAVKYNNCDHEKRRKFQTYYTNRIIGYLYTYTNKQTNTKDPSKIHCLYIVNI